MSIKSLPILKLCWYANNYCGLLGPCHVMSCHVNQGVTMVSLMDFLRGSIGMFPWVAICSYIGSALSSVSDVFNAHHSKSYKVMLYVGYSVGGVITCVVAYMIVGYTRHAFQEALRQRGGHDTPGPQGNEGDDNSLGHEEDDDEEEIVVLDGHGNAGGHSLDHRLIG